MYLSRYRFICIRYSSSRVAGILMPPVQIVDFICYLPYLLLFFFPVLFFNALSIQHFHLLQICITSFHRPYLSSKQKLNDEYELRFISPSMNFVNLAPKFEEQFSSLTCQCNYFPNKKEIGRRRAYGALTNARRTKISGRRVYRPCRSVSLSPPPPP